MAVRRRSLAAYGDALVLVRFEPSGWTSGGQGLHSIADYLVRWLDLRWPDADRTPDLDDPPDPVPDGETCGVCGTPRTWEPGDACGERGHIAAAA